MCQHARAYVSRFDALVSSAAYGTRAMTQSADPQWEFVLNCLHPKLAVACKALMSLA